MVVLMCYCWHFSNLQKFSLEGEEVAVRVVVEAGAVAVQDGKIYEAEAVLKFFFLNYLVEELGYVFWWIGKGTAAHGG